MQMCSNLIPQNLKVTYHENLTTSTFKCYNRVPGASTNPEKREKEQPSNFFLVSLSLQACEKASRTDFAPPMT